MLFPSPKVNSTLDNQLASVKHHLDSSAFIDQSTKSQAIKEIDELVMELGRNLTAEKKLVGLSKVCTSLNIESMPKLESESLVYKR